MFPESAGPGERSRIDAIDRRPKMAERAKKSTTAEKKNSAGTPQKAARAKADEPRPSSQKRRHLSRRRHQGRPGSRESRRPRPFASLSTPRRREKSVWRGPLTIGIPRRTRCNRTKPASGYARFSSSPENTSIASSLTGIGATTRRMPYAVGMSSVPRTQFSFCDRLRPT